MALMNWMAKTLHFIWSEVDFKWGAHMLSKDPLDVVCRMPCVRTRIDAGGRPEHRTWLEK